MTWLTPFPLAAGDLHPYLPMELYMLHKKKATEKTSIAFCLHEGFFNQPCSFSEAHNYKALG